MLSYFSNNRWSLQNALNRQENRIVGGGTSLAGSEMTALDLWRTVSIAFIYAACAEFVLVNFLGKRSTKKSKVSQLQELLDHQRQKMQQQLDKLRLEFNSRMNMRASTPQVSFCYVYQIINTRYKYLGNFEKILHVFGFFSKPILKSNLSRAIIALLAVVVVLWPIYLVSRSLCM